MSNPIVDEVFEETLNDLKKLKPCKTCVFSNETCTWCTENKTKIYPFQYGCNKHLTNEAAVRKLAEIEYQKYCKEIARMTLDMDVMGYTISAAAIMLEKIDMELERSHKEIADKTDDCIKKHQESKKHRDRLRKAYAQMKAHTTDMRNVYDRYIEYFFTYQFTDENGKYNGKEADKNLANSGIVSKVIKLFVDRALDNKENAGKIIDFMLSLQGSGIYDEHDLNAGIIR